ncbi:MAG: PIN domain-containing protein [Blastocatellia bacterium]|nr:PIN domain-containing protein [Blastocatellia bacterium]
MTKFLLDTNLLLRSCDQLSPDRLLAERAVAKLLGNGDEAYLTTQNLIEFWDVVTRPRNVNGFDWTTQRAEAELKLWLNKFPLLPDPSDVLTHWLRLVAQHDIKGRRTHDARLVAVMLAHGVTHLLTFNTGDFTSFTKISLVHPSDL